MAGWELINRTSDETAVQGTVVPRNDAMGKAMRIAIRKPGNTKRDLQLEEDWLE